MKTARQQASRFSEGIRTYILAMREYEGKRYGSNIAENKDGLDMELVKQ